MRPGDVRVERRPTQRRPTANDCCRLPRRNWLAYVTSFPPRLYLTKACPLNLPNAKPSPLQMPLPLDLHRRRSRLLTPPVSLLRAVSQPAVELLRRTGHPSVPPMSSKMKRRLPDTQNDIDSGRGLGRRRDHRGDRHIVALSFRSHPAETARSTDSAIVPIRRLCDAP